jgi:hypothetical protein
LSSKVQAWTWLKAPTICTDFFDFKQKIHKIKYLR